MDKKYPYKIDVSVLLIFFCRPGPFRQTFSAVKKARPSKLFLYQDGPREGRPDDANGIAECRAIAEDIDWECEVHKFYQEKNVGCDPSEYIAQTWAFKHVDRCIILEDDDVADQSFFPYCKELLERYKDDERIAMICGMNHLGEYHDNGCSYLFTNMGPITGWASWRRVVGNWEEHYDSLENPYVVKFLKRNFRDIALQEHLPVMFNHKSENIAYYESILGLSRFTQNRLCIVPSVNLIKNVGNCAEAAHTSNSTHFIYSLPLLGLDFPLKHPKYVINDVEFAGKVRFRQEGCPSPLRKFLRKCKRLIRNMLWKGL